MSIFEYITSSRIEMNDDETIKIIDADKLITFLKNKQQEYFMKTSIDFLNSKKIPDNYEVLKLDIDLLIEGIKESTKEVTIKK